MRRTRLLFGAASSEAEDDDDLGHVLRVVPFSLVANSRVVFLDTQ